jgi:hypothetical protein
VGSSNVTTITAAWVTFHTALTSAGLDFCVASYKLATEDPVAALTCETFTATQRRRNVRNSQ